MKADRKKTLGARFRAAGSSGTKAHIISRKGHWVIFKEGSDRILSEYSTRKIAILNGKKILESGEADKLVLHKPDGTVEKVQLAD
ncbi:DUF2188 domain-containing protein [Lutibacter maritimus]|uniref:DUF2188 domain-containing protein n=1 Tax=Lutibacter maritimus TaxID=593133 RepID=A0A1I6NRW6_9FLAO|nr:DUF2188 domain-containing protein [Lutibacter maritimus]SFS30610.1 hypothetical protein SAMN04488006_0459 [Lutibacter maritimus]